MAHIPSPFPYRPLPNPHQTIRLLTLHASPSSSSPIRCSLFTSSLLHVGPYSTLSYVWGSPHHTTTIFVSSHSVPITTNLASALLHLRDAVRDLNLWVDALCINQADIAEKSVQVRLMAQIYRNAGWVLCWLGDGAGDAKGEMQLALRALGNVVDCDAAKMDLCAAWKGLDATTRRNRISGLRTRLLAGSVGREEEIDDYLDMNMADGRELALMDILGERASSAIKNLFGREWWRRTWICQEFLLARVPVFVCGAEMFDGLRVVSGMDLFLSDRGNYRHPYYYDAPGGTRVATDTIWQRTALASLVHRKYMSATHPHRYPIQPLVGLIHSFRDMDCSDLRDKVYAMIGIATDEMARLNPPDYSITLPEVMERLFTTWTESNQNLDIMTYRPQGRRPTWRPDFGQSYGSFSSPLLHTSVNFGRSIYSVSLGTRPAYTICQSESANRVLHISGIHLDRVLDVGSPMLSSPASDSDLVISSWIQVAAKVSASTLDFWYTLTVGMNLQDQRLSTEAVQSFRDELAAWLSHGQDQTRRPETLESALSPMRSSTSTFFITQNGRLGMGRYVKPGDELCILFGGQAPFLLRQAEQGMYEMIEDCYVNGVMDGEVMRDYEQGNHVEKTFRIC